MDAETLGDRMESLLDSKMKAMESLERSEKILMKYMNQLGTIRDAMRDLRTQHRIILLSEYENLKGRENDVLRSISLRKEQIEQERYALKDLDLEIETTMIDINQASKHMAVLEFNRDRRRNQA